MSEWTVDFVMGSVKRRGERERKMKMREKDNVYSGIAYGYDGVKMFGKWGIIISGSFSLDLNNEKIKFFNKPRLTIN